MILAVLQARVSSSRLPGKVLRPILGVPMILRQVERIKQAGGIDHLLVATSIAPSDDPLADLCIKNGIDCFRGDLEDVLDRFFHAASSRAPDHIVRLTGDCPLADPVLIDQVIQFHLENSFDYTSNALQPTFPDGLDVEIFRFSSLVQAWQEAELPSHREHVTPFIYQQPERFRIGSYHHDKDLSYLRWTVDEPKDMELVIQIYQNLYSPDRCFYTKDILDFLDRNSGLKELNSEYARNEGFQKSLIKDKCYNQNKGKK